MAIDILPALQTDPPKLDFVWPGFLVGTALFARKTVSWKITEDARGKFEVERHLLLPGPSVPY